MILRVSGLRVFVVIGNAYIYDSAELKKALTFFPFFRYGCISSEEEEGLDEAAVVCI